MLVHSKKLAFVWAIVGLLALPAMNAIADEAEGEAAAASEAAVASEKAEGRSLPAAWRRSRSLAARRRAWKPCRKFRSR